jgi:hypothetical protein
MDFSLNKDERLSGKTDEQCPESSNVKMEGFGGIDRRLPFNPSAGNGNDEMPLSTTEDMTAEKQFGVNLDLDKFSTEAAKNKQGSINQKKRRILSTSGTSGSYGVGAEEID